eukprot:1970213-Pleurochrysis_carterae.AAC.1
MNGRADSSHKLLQNVGRLLRLCRPREPSARALSGSVAPPSAACKQMEASGRCHRLCSLS